MGDDYTLGFYQAGAQQTTTANAKATTERWQVSLGSETQLSQLMDSPPSGYHPWEAQSMTFVASAASEVLSFLAIGTPVGAPPVSLLADVSLQPRSVPDPGSLAPARSASA